MGSALRALLPRSPRVSHMHLCRLAVSAGPFSVPASVPSGRRDWVPALTVRVQRATSQGPRVPVSGSPRLPVSTLLFYVSRCPRLSCPHPCLCIPQSLSPSLSPHLCLCVSVSSQCPSPGAPLISPCPWHPPGPIDRWLIDRWKERPRRPGLQGQAGAPVGRWTDGQPAPDLVAVEGELWQPLPRWSAPCGWGLRASFNF